MPEFTIGIPGGGRDTAAAVESGVRAEQQGLSAVWFTSASGLDPIVISALVAARTERVRIGTAIAHMWAMPPVKMAQIGQIAAQLSGGRFRLGIGAGSPVTADTVYGQRYHTPLGHLREYVTIVKRLVETGAVDYQGRYYRANTRLAGTPTPMPVMIAALGKGSFELAGEVADGAISWVTPGAYIRDVGAPALRAAAERAGRPAPPIVAHVPIAVHENLEEVREAGRKQFSFYVRAPHYQAMFAAAGFGEAKDGAWSDAMLDAVIVSGDESTVERRLQEISDWGAAELLVSPIAGPGEDRTRALLARLAAR